MMKSLGIGGGKEASDDRPGPKQSCNAWGIAPAAAVESSTDRSTTSLADIIAEQESEKTKRGNTLHKKVLFYDLESEEGQMMRLATMASLRDQQHQFNEKDASVLKKSHVSFSSTNTAYDNNHDTDDKDLKMAIALSLASPSANAAINSGPDFRGDLHDNIETISDNKQDESEKLARALHQAEIEEYNALRSAYDAAGEAASIALAIQLQREEDARHLNSVAMENDANAARLKREKMCRAASVGATGVITVDRDEFQQMQRAKLDMHYGGSRIIERRKEEGIGMGILLDKKHYFEDSSDDLVGVQPSDDSDSYYYYASDRLQADDDDDGMSFNHEKECFGIKMNSQSASSNWQRVDKDTFIGPGNEIKSKHDLELKHKSNAINLLDGDTGNSSSVSDRAYNSFRRSEARQSGMKKGVLKQGHGRAENMDASKTRGGAMDGNVRLQIAAAVNLGLIDKCNGVVKEGKEGLVYHAESGWKGKGMEGYDNSTEGVDSDGYDVAVKVFKRISEFKNRRDYVDGDPRYFKQKFKTHDAREQVVLWTEKEYRNLLRAWRGGVSVPKPLHQKENILFMRFLGEDGWPSPQLREIQMRKGSEKWTTLYCQTLVTIRRLYHCSRLIHGDLSEYNILICPHWQVRHGPFLSAVHRTSDDEGLQVVLIDFGQAVEIGHPAANELLRRDLSTVTQFFINQGITALTTTEAEKFVVEASCSFAETIDENDDHDNKKEVSKKTCYRRNSGAVWDDTNEMKALLEKLESSKLFPQSG